MPKLIVDENGRDCSACKDYKTWEHFSKFKQSPTGRKAMCRDCCKLYYKGLTAHKKEEFECKMNPMMKAFLVDRIHLKNREAA